MPKAPPTQTPLSSAPYLNVDKHSAVPAYQQLVNGVQEAIRSGMLVPGDPLPPMRAVALSVGVNQMTVSKAYKLLSHQGWVRGQSGAGTRVLERVGQDAPSDSKVRPGEARDDRVLQSMAELSQAPGVISFSDAYPSFSQAKLDAFRLCLNRALETAGTDVFCYGAPGGRSTLRTLLAEIVAGHIAPIRPSQLVVTSGAQQALDICTRHLLQPGDTIIVESPCYFGALDLFRSLKLKVIELPVTHDGIDPDAFERACETHAPVAFYTIPTVHNPTGVTTPLARRRRILKSAARHRVTIIEDDYCPEFLYSGNTVPSYHRLAGEHEDPVPVFYIRSLGKAHLPGVRLGFLIATPDSLAQIIAIKRSTDLHGPLLLQAAAETYLRETLSSRLYLLNLDEVRLDAQSLYELLSAELPPSCTSRMISGGFSFWVSFAAPIDDERLYQAAARHSVAFALGSAFVYSGNGRSSGIRVSFGRLTREQVVEGVRRLTKALSNAAAPEQEQMDFVI